MTDLEKQLTDLPKGNQAGALSNPMTENHPTEPDHTRPKTIAGATEQPKEYYQPKERTCWGCSAVTGIIDCGNARSYCMPRR